MATCCNIVYNSELILNEFHNNNYHFILNSIPVSFLLSKFNSKCLNTLGPTKEDMALFNNLDAYKEANNDVRNLALFTQEVNFPGISVQESQLGVFSGNDFKTVSGKMVFEPLTVTFMVDEHFFIPRFFHYWMIASANPHEFAQYNQRQYTDGFYVDAHLLLTDNNRDKTIEVKFNKIHPTSLSAVPLIQSQPDKVKMTVTFLYQGYEFSDDYNAVYRKV